MAALHRTSKVVCLPPHFKQLIFRAYIYIYIFFFIQYLSRGIQFSRASLNGALTKHKNRDIKTLKLDN